MTKLFMGDDSSDNVTYNKEQKRFNEAWCALYRLNDLYTSSLHAQFNLQPKNRDATNTSKKSKEEEFLKSTFAQESNTAKLKKR